MNTRANKDIHEYKSK